MCIVSKLVSSLSVSKRINPALALAGIFFLGISAQCSAAIVRFQPIPTSEIASGVVNFSALAERTEWHPPMVHEPMQSLRELDEKDDHIPQAITPTSHTGFFAPTGRWSTQPSPGPTTTFDLALGQGAPPDATGAASAKYLVTTTNGGISIHNVFGKFIRSAGPLAFFASILPPVKPGHFQLPFDPHVRYDKDLNRFILVYTYLQAVTFQNVVQSRLLVAVSQTTDPTAGWNLFSIDGSDANTGWLDFPTVGTSADLLLISVARYPNNEPPTGGTVTNQMYAIAKETLSQATPPPIYQITWPYQQDRPFYWSPANSSTQPGVVLFGDLQNADGVPTITQTARITRLAKGAAFQPDVSRFPRQAEFGNGTNYNRQLGSTSPLPSCASNYSATVIGNSITLLQGTFLPYLDGYISGARVLELDSTTLLPTRSIDLDGRSEQRAICFAGLRRNSRGDTLVGFSTATPLSYLSAAYSLQLLEDPVDQFRNFHIYRAGVTAFEFGRQGDYSATTIAENGVDFWTLQESGGASNQTTLTWALVRPALPTAVPNFRSAADDPPPGTLGCFFGLRWKPGIPSPSQYNISEVCQNGAETIVSVPATRNYLRTHSGPLGAKCTLNTSNQYSIQGCNDSGCGPWSRSIAHSPSFVKCGYSD
jgi:hypothetical protein